MVAIVGDGRRSTFLGLTLDGWTKNFPNLFEGISSRAKMKHIMAEALNDG